jgi:putative ABC transport system ATP-binding protein
VAIARAMSMQPALILADEPTGNLDRQAGQEVITVLERLHHDGGTVMLVTHDPEVGARARRRVRMVDGAVVSDERP